MFFQIEPEYRTVTNGTAIDRTTTARYPNVFGAIGSQRWVFGIGASTLLDRTSTTRAVTRETVGGDPIDVTTTFAIDGAVNDLRLDGFAATSWLRLGVGLHALTGRNLVTVAESFSDTVSFVGFSQQRDLSYSGGAVSFGAHLVSKSVVGAASMRFGGTMHLTAIDTVIGTANVPSRMSASLAYVGIANSTIAVRTCASTGLRLTGLDCPLRRGTTRGTRVAKHRRPSVAGASADAARWGAHPYAAISGIGNEVKEKA